jgi:hypothetical protein
MYKHSYCFWYCHVCSILSWGVGTRELTGQCRWQHVATR